MVALDALVSWMIFLYLSWLQGLRCLVALPSWIV